MELEPEAERIWLLVGAREYMSDGCALSIVWRVRYCFDCGESV
jgi:hypothetical protein